MNFCKKYAKKNKSKKVENTADLSHFSSLAFYAVSKTFERSRKKRGPYVNEIFGSKRRGAVNFRKSFPTREKHAIKKSAFRYLFTSVEIGRGRFQDDRNFATNHLCMLCVRVCLRAIKLFSKY